MTLYEIIPAYRSLIDEYNEAETEEDASRILSQIELVDAVFEEKIESMVKAWKNLEADLPGLSDEIARLSAIKQRAELRVATYKEVVKNAILSSGRPEPKVKTSIGTISVQRNGGQPSVFYEGDAKNLPKAFRNIVPLSYEIDSKAIADEHKHFEDRLADALKDFRKHKLAEEMQTGDWQSAEDCEGFFIHQFEKKWREEVGLPDTVKISRGYHARLR